MKPTHLSPRKAAGGAKKFAPEPDAERARAIVAYLRTAEPSSTEVFDAFWQLDALPVNHVRDALAAWVGPLPDVEHLDPAMRRAHGLPPRALRLRTVSIARDADLLDLGPVVEAQLRLAGTTWDGADLAPEDRLDGEVEGSFAGTVERRVLADADDEAATPLFDVLLFAEDAGVVFAASTTTVTALIAYRKVETLDRRTRTAIEAAIAATDAPAAEGLPRSAAATDEAEKPSTTGPAQVASREAPAKKVAVKRTPAKKVAAKKAPANKAPAKKVAAKKAPAKKVATRKGPVTATRKSEAAKNTVTKPARAKKATSRGAAAKKATSEGAAAKKASPKKAAARKAAKPKAPSRKPAAGATKKAARVARR
jgi:hypothetical protein